MEQPTATGPSTALPFVAAMAGAAAAWLLADDSSLTFERVAALLRNSAQDSSRQAMTS